jgi:hypothetical protein
MEDAGYPGRELLGCGGVGRETSSASVIEAVVMRQGKDSFI